MAIKILLADDHLVVLQGLRFFLNTQKDFDIVGEASNGAEAVALVDELKPDVVLMDLVMPELDGIEATKKIKETLPDVKVIVLTSFADQDHVLPALRAGAEGYQLKDIEPDELARTIRAAYRGEKMLHPQATQQLLSQMTGAPAENDGNPKIEDLTPREKDVLQQITLGKSNKEISADLYITEKTVKTHVSSILSKFELHDRTQAAILAMKNGWFD
ncbi:MAG TPA: response regulator transcription factor [Bacillales bacterium]|nr:response regulator transcription factor [Bacillales bacterium]